MRYLENVWAIVKHVHKDHAGPITDMVVDGITCIFFENQMQAIDAMEETIWKSLPDYGAIDKTRLTQLRIADSREFLQQLGVRGEILRTNGHTSDSLSFLSDEHKGVIGDLYPLEFVMPDDEKGMRAGS